MVETARNQHEVVAIESSLKRVEKINISYKRGFDQSLVERGQTGL